MEVLEIEQRSDDWYKIRAGKLTASNAKTIYTGGKGLETLCISLIADYYSTTESEHYISEDMQRGIDLEDVARARYEAETGKEVKEVGFCLLNEFVGASPDGVIYKGKKIVKSIEIKCPKNSVYMNVLLNDYIDSGYYAQMQFQMLVLGTKEVDYVVFNPNFEKDIIIKTIKRDEEFITKLLDGILKGTNLLKKYHEKMKG